MDDKDLKKPVPEQPDDSDSAENAAADNIGEPKPEKMGVEDEAPCGDVLDETAKDDDNDDGVKDDNDKTVKEDNNDDGAKEDDSQWQFDGEVNTDIDALKLTYSGNEIEINDADPKKSKDEMVITIDKAKVRRNMKIASIAVATVLAGILVFFAVWFSFVVPNKSEAMLPANIALSVDGRNVSVGEYNFYYNEVTSDSSLQNFASSYGLDTTKDYDKQYVDAEETQTWEERFEELAINQMKYIMSLAEKAKEKGLELTDAQQKAIDEQIDSIKSSASGANKSTSEYITENYGENVGVKTIKKVMKTRLLAQNYYQLQQMEKNFEDEELQTYLSEHEEDFSTVSFRYIPFEYTADDEAAVAQAKAKAQTFIDELTDESTFIEIAKKHIDQQYVEYVTDSSTLMAGVSKANTSIPSDMMEWMFSDDVAVNDKNIFQSDEQGCFFAVMLVRTKGLDTDAKYSVRHILVQPEKEDESTDAEYTEEQWNAAKEKADEIYAGFKDGDKSEASFAKLAEEKSDDVASTTAGSNGTYGGFYEAVSKGRMVEEFENWSLDSQRKYGDTEIVKSQHGYHIMFFVSAQEAWKYDAQDALTSEKNEKMIESIKTEKKSAFDKCTVAVAGA